MPSAAEIVINNLAIILTILGNLLLGLAVIDYGKRYKATVLKNSQESEIREKELKRRVLELQVLRTLSERAGYSLDLRKTLEVITDSLEGLVDFCVVSYMLLAPEGRIILKVRVQKAVSRNFLDQVKNQMLNSFSAMTRRQLHPSLIDETMTGNTLDERLAAPVASFFNLPLIIGGQVVALINVSSTQIGLYGDADTAVLYTILSQVSTQASQLSQVVENEKRKLSAMISSLTDGIMMIDLNFNLIVSNPAVAYLLDLKRGVNLFDVSTSLAGKVDIRGAVGQSLQHQGMVKIPEFELGSKALQIDVEPVKDKLGYQLGAVVIFHDVTSQRQLEKLREDFTAMMVHELRTPLTTISYGTAELLDDLPQVDAQKLQENLKIVKSTTAEMLSLVNDLLDVAKIEAGKFMVMKRDTDLKQLLEEKITLFKPLTDHKQLKLILEMDDNLPHILFDRRRLSQALDNLLSNAVKYTDKGQIVLGLHIVSQKAVISVTDSGEGIQTEDIPKLFSKFEQLGKGKTGEKSGTGLGLVITKGIIEAHGGKMEVTSEGLGQGSTFSFILPLE